MTDNGEHVTFSLAHKIELDQTKGQVAYFRQAAGTSRFVWNEALRAWDKQFDFCSAVAKAAKELALARGLSEADAKWAGQLAAKHLPIFAWTPPWREQAPDAPRGWPNAAKLKTAFNAAKYEKFTWLREVHRDAHARPFLELQKAFATWRKRRREVQAAGKPAKHGKPKFKKRGRTGDSFYVANDRLSVVAAGDATPDGPVCGPYVVLPVVGRVRMREALRFTGKIMSATVSRTADKWFVSISVETEEPRPPKPNKKDGTPRQAPLEERRHVTGVDLGINHYATCSDGRVFDAPKPLKAALKRLRRAQRTLSRRKRERGQKQSKNYRKVLAKIAKIHMRVANVRADFIHKMVTTILRENQAVVVEDLNVSGMSRGRLSRSLADVAMGEALRQFRYKAPIYGTRLVVADRWFPSSKTCSGCGVVNHDLRRGDRIFRCGVCGLVIDRDANAARNLENYEKNYVPAACGEVTPADSGKRLG